MDALEFVLPGDPRTRTGGYEYDRRIVDGLRALGWIVRVHSLDGAWPRPAAVAVAAAERRFAALPDGALVAVDGLAFGALPSVAAAHASRLRLVALVHHPLAAESGIAPQAAADLAASERAALAGARLVVVTSASTAEALLAYDVPPARLVVIEPGTDPAPLARGSGGERVRLLCVATLTPRKGHAHLFDALAGLVSRAWTLDCVGSAQRDPVTAAALATRLERLGISGRVRLLGEIEPDALAAAYLAADAFVSAASYEGYGMAIAEALAHGLPVVATRTGAAPSLLADGAGLLVPPDDVAALRAALARVVGDAALRAACATAAASARRRLPRWEDSGARLAAALAAVA